MTNTANGRLLCSFALRTYGRNGGNDIGAGDRIARERTHDERRKAHGRGRLCLDMQEETSGRARWFRYMLDST